MAYVLEFGVRGGAHVDSIIVPTTKLAVQMACALVATYTNDWSHPSASPASWSICASQNHRTARQTWQSATHFVALSRLNDPRNIGSALGKLWRVPHGT